ncbi:MAG: tolB protein precursor, periplasmic protein involved in the tonb-independent uptake of group A colicins [uncultured Thermomicrobiales bacterium]|uniref:TolB protein, periplasmic protein involved in the tonb-independent uptake of group A colicins n=1 Tax=uncultured Thermomicrobiales bacterium TaxID=1645740 RepID=A0A6J4V8S9_9BACT|nr:MAG: tolB protein precursor, periplasmic protein involved in the tonb-independent uptake of group A colicins [uncultured Thermomicrobiales bacterium]
MSRRSTSLGLLAAACLTLASTLSAAAFPIELPPKPRPTLAATQTVLGGDDLAALALSPDGSTFAAWDLSGDGAICAMSLDTGPDPDCVPFRAAIALDSVRWSPDGTRFVFTEDATRQLLESDIWLFDVSTGELTNLTDDGDEGSMLRDRDETDQAMVDIAPAWSPDGTQIVFSRSRSIDSGVEENALYRLPADGSGPAEEIAVVSGTPLAAYGGIHWPEDDRILYTVAAPGGAPEDGIWAIDPDGDRPERLIEPSRDEEAFPLLLLDVAADGSGIIVDRLARQTIDVPPRTAYFLADFETGDLRPLDFGASEMTVDDIFATGSDIPLHITAVGLSPDGQSLAMSIVLADQSREIRLLDLESGDYTVAVEHEHVLGQTDQRPGIDWSTGDRLMASSAGRTAVLFELTPAD